MAKDNRQAKAICTLFADNYIANQKTVLLRHVGRHVGRAAEGHELVLLAAEHIHRHGVRHRRLPASRTAGARPHLQHRVRRLTRRSDIRDAVHESFLTRRQQHRRPLDLGRLLPKERKNGQNKTFLFIILIEFNCFLGLFPSSI